jgi:hypothetical protein
MNATVLNAAACNGLQIAQEGQSRPKTTPGPRTSTILKTDSRPRTSTNLGTEGAAAITVEN